MKVDTKYGSFYIENWEGREEEDRVKLYDSLGRYLDYFSVESIEETWNGSWSAFAGEIMRGALKFTKVEEFLDYLGIGALIISTDWKDLLDELGLNKETSTKEDVLKNEWVNVIGNNYILVCE